MTRVPPGPCRDARHTWHRETFLNECLSWEFTLCPAWLSSLALPASWRGGAFVLRSCSQVINHRDFGGPSAVRLTRCGDGGQRPGLAASSTVTPSPLEQGTRGEDSVWGAWGKCRKGPERRDAEWGADGKLQTETRASHPSPAGKF